MVLLKGKQVSMNERPITVEIFDTVDLTEDILRRLENINEVYTDIDKSRLRLRSSEVQSSYSFAQTTKGNYLEITFIYVHGTYKELKHTSLFTKCQGKTLDNNSRGRKYLRQGVKYVMGDRITMPLLDSKDYKFIKGIFVEDSLNHKGLDVVYKVTHRVKADNLSDDIVVDLVSEIENAINSRKL